MERPDPLDSEDELLDLGVVDLDFLATAFRLVQSAVLGANLLNHRTAVLLLEGDGLLGGHTTGQRDSLVLQPLETHRFGYFIALDFFAVHLALLGWLIHRSGYLPRWLGAAAAGHLVDIAWFFVSPGYDGAFSPLALAPALVAEISLLLWRPVRPPRRTVTVLLPPNRP